MMDMYILLIQISFGYKRKVDRDIGFYNGGFFFYIDDDLMLEDMTIEYPNKDYIECNKF